MAISRNKHTGQSAMISPPSLLQGYARAAAIYALGKLIRMQGCYTDAIFHAANPELSLSGTAGTMRHRRVASADFSDLTRTAIRNAVELEFLCLRGVLRVSLDAALSALTQTAATSPISRIPANP